MMKETYVQPAVTKHELLRDITAKRSGHGGGHGHGHGFGHGFGHTGGRR
jgi:hypothetical protein